MTRVSATKLRNNLFEYLDKAVAGETVVIERYSREVARLVPTQQLNWRDKMNVKPEFLVPPEDLIEPVGDIWEEYV
jgi:prevent-host-death family protein